MKYRVSIDRVEAFLIEEEGGHLVRCRRCGRWIDLRLGADSPGAYPDRTGTEADPLPPGDRDDVCAACGYA